MTAKKTALYDCHVKLNGQMVEFAGTWLPVRYHSEKEEHLAVRNDIGIFDVSHMGEFFIKGENAEEFLQYVLSNNVQNLSDNQAHYSLLLNHSGGIIDDLIVYKFSRTHFMLCVNASNIDKDWAWINEQASSFDNLSITNDSAEISQIAVQGPKAMALLKTLSDERDTKEILF